MRQVKAVNQNKEFLGGDTVGGSVSIWTYLTVRGTNAEQLRKLWEQDRMRKLQYFYSI